MTVTSNSPVLQRRRLGAELRRLREAAGKKLDEVAEYLECSEAKISRIETDKDPERVERQVQLRMERQKRLFEDNPLRLHAILDEGLINRPVGGRQVMDEQFAHLVKMAQLPNVTIQLLGMDEGAYPGMGVPFHL